MDRLVLTDAQWSKMEPLCLGKPGDPGRRGKDNRLFVEAVLWIAQSGSQACPQGHYRAGQYP
jgi:transposase